MAGSLNKVVLIGNLGKDPEIRSMQNGNEVATFSLATTDYWKDKNTGEKKEKTEWHKIVVFSEGLVGVVKNYVKKGSRLYIEGALQTRKWTDKQGKDNYTTEIVLQGYNATILLLGGNDSNNSGNSGNSGNSTKQRSKSAQEADDFHDEIPF